MSDEYYLPQKTVQQLTPDRLQRCKNLGLILDKYPTRAAVGRWPAGRGANGRGANGRGEEKSGGERSAWLKQFESDNHIDPQLVKSINKRWELAVKAMQAQCFTAKTAWRIVVGLGGGTILETDLTLHHLYGIPCIPGSALKGLTRAYVTGEVYKSKKIEDDDPAVQRIFGTQKEAGSVIFFDAMPADDRIKFDLDIMNAHYPKYYAEKWPPANDQDPNPVTFLTVAETTFMFALAPRRPKDAEDVTLAVTWLQDALQKYGVGGKTSAGYGYFNLPQQRETTNVQLELEQPAAVPYVRPNIPKFVEGQGISGTVIVPTDDLRHRVPEAKAFLRYREFLTKDVLIIVDAEEAKDWATGQTKNCLFLREEEREGCTVLICRPGAAKKKKK